MTMSYLPMLLLLQLLTGARSAYIAPATVQQLYSDLTTSYDPRLRPTYDQSHKVWLNVSATPFTVLELSTSDQRLTIMLLVTISWRDQFMVWNSTLYDGIERVTLNADQIWHPKLMVGLTYTDKFNYLGDSADQVEVQSNGTVLWMIVSAVPVLCLVEITFYPFDTQKCSIYLYPPYTSYEEIGLNIIPGYEQHKSVFENPEWHLLDIQSAVVNGELMGKSISYTYLLRRRAEFVVHTTVVPLIMLSVLNACVVLVPVSSGEKGSIAVTLFLSYCVYLTAIAVTLPPNSSNTSYLLVYMTIVQTFSALAMLYCIVQTRLYINGNELFKSCMSGNSKLSRSKYDSKDDRNSNQVDVKDTGVRDSGESHYENTTEKPCEEARDEGLDVHRRLDSLAFMTSVVLNTAVVAVFVILTANSIQHKLE